MSIHPGFYILIGIWLLPTALLLLGRRFERPHSWLGIAATLSLSWLGWVLFSLMAADD